MSTAKIPQGMGRDAHAFLDASNGASNLYDVLQALAKGSAGDVDSGLVASPAAAVIQTKLVHRDSRLGSLGLSVGTTGSAGTTTLTVNVAGSSVGSVSVENTDADGTVTREDLTDVLVPAGSLVTLELTAVATGAANVVASAALEPVEVG